MKDSSRRMADTQDSPGVMNLDSPWKIKQDVSDLCCSKGVTPTFSVLLRQATHPEESESISPKYLV